MLATHNTGLAAEYDVIIVGSGYGGAITAARLGFANKRKDGKLRIALLERGREHAVGSFPDRFDQVMGEVHNHLLNPLGLYDYITGDDIDIIKGNGLGGTSLINANVAIRPDEDVFTHGWPQAIAVEAAEPSFDKSLWRYYARAERMLGAQRFGDPSINPLGRELAKLPALRAAAKAAGGTMDDQGYANITVSSEDRVTRFGISRKECTNCGDCVTGCNIGAKNTLAMNYLPMAAAYGVKLFTEVTADRVEKLEDGRYRIVWHRTPDVLAPVEHSVTARIVILAAGSPATPALLLRSLGAGSGLALSPRVGEQWSGNGDFISLAYNSDLRTDIMGFDRRGPPRSEVKAGPTIAGVFRLHRDEAVKKRFCVEDLSCPSAIVDELRRVLFASTIIGTREARDTTAERDRWLRDLRWDPKGALNHTLGFLIMGDDGAGGRVELKGNHAKIVWPDAPWETIYKDINKTLTSATKTLGGTYIPNPRWRYVWLGHNLITAHPLGGCATADDSDHGVVDHLGRVFDASGSVHEGLYVSDGSILPEALGVNPFLTISAFTERMIDALRRQLDLPLYDESVEGDDK